MSTVSRYFLENRNGNEESGVFDNVEEARQEARSRHLRLIEVTYEFSDSELVEDHTLCPECEYHHEPDTHHFCADCGTQLTDADGEDPLEVPGLGRLVLCSSGIPNCFSTRLREIDPEP